MSKTPEQIVADLQSMLATTKVEITRLEADILAKHQLVKDTETTLKTLRLMGICSGPAESFATPAKATVGKPKPTVPEMILTVLGMDQFKQPGAEPGQVLQVIRDQIDLDADPNNVRPTLWRMREKGILEKIEGRYRIPIKTEGGDPNLFEGTESSTSDQKPEAQGREAGPGGGT